MTAGISPGRDEGQQVAICAQDLDEPWPEDVSERVVADPRDGVDGEAVGRAGHGIQRPVEQILRSQQFSHAV